RHSARSPAGVRVASAPATHSRPGCARGRSHCRRLSGARPNRRGYTARADRDASGGSSDNLEGAGNLYTRNEAPPGSVPITLTMALSAGVPRFFPESGEKTRFGVENRRSYRPKDIPDQMISFPYQRSAAGRKFAGLREAAGRLWGAHLAPYADGMAVGRNALNNLRI